MIDLSLDGKVAIVTGGSKGIGLAIATEFAERGAKVCICARGEDVLSAAKERVERAGGREILTVRADVTSSEDLENVVARTIDFFGGVDLLVNNALFVPERSGASAADITKTDYMRVLEGNVWAPLRLAQLCRQSMIDRGGGVVINIGSVSGILGEPGLGAYGVSKAALMNLTKQLAKEWGSDKIRVVGIAPGLVRTELTSKPGGLVEYLVANNLVPGINGAIGEPEHIAAVALLLASDAGGYFNGSSVVVDGGEVIRGVL